MTHFSFYLLPLKPVEYLEGKRQNFWFRLIIASSGKKILFLI